jgi:hypothetical protein
LRLTKGLREKDRAVRIERRHSVGISLGPRQRPPRDPSVRGGAGVYFATSTARLSRMTMTFT